MWVFHREETHVQNERSTTVSLIQNLAVINRNLYTHVF